jgi:hypothetical protein
LALTISLTTPGLATAQDAVSLKFELDDRGAVIIPAFVNGLGPFRFLVDTGSSASAVSEALQARIGAPIVAKSELVTPAGRQFRTVARLERLTVGPVESESLAAILPAAALAAASTHLDGIIGQDLLGRRPYTISYRRRTMTWDVRPDEGGTRLSLISRDGRVLVELPQAANRILHLVPDSGTDGLVLFSRGGIVPLATDRVAVRTQLGGLLGTADVAPAVVRMLKVGAITLRDQPAVIVARNEIDAPAGDGLLPLHHFSSVTFDGGYIVFRR